MKPNFIFAPFPELDAFSSKKRISKSVNNSNVFLKTVLEIIKKENLEIKNIWPVITGGSDRASRLASAGDFLLNFQNYPDYFKGVIFGGFNHGESSQDSFDLLKLCVVSFSFLFHSLRKKSQKLKRIKYQSPSSALPLALVTLVRHSPRFPFSFSHTSLFSGDFECRGSRCGFIHFDLSLCCC